MGEAIRIYSNTDNRIESSHQRAEVNSSLVSHNVTILGKRTSIRLELEMWDALNDIAQREDCKIHDICSLVHARKKPDMSLTSAVRVFLMLYYRAASTQDGHSLAGHGSFIKMRRRAKLD